MKHIRERIVAIMLVILQIMTLVPTGAYALNPEDSINGYVVSLDCEFDNNHPLDDYYVMLRKNNTNLVAFKSIQEIHAMNDGWIENELYNYYYSVEKTYLDTVASCSDVSCYLIKLKEGQTVPDPNDTIYINPGDVEEVYEYSISTSPSGIGSTISLLKKKTHSITINLYSSDGTTITRSDEADGAEAIDLSNYSYAVVATMRDRTTNELAYGVVSGIKFTDVGQKTVGIYSVVKLSGDEEGYTEGETDRYDSEKYKVTDVRLYEGSSDENWSAKSYNDYYAGHDSASVTGYHFKADPDGNVYDSETDTTTLNLVKSYPARYQVQIHISPSVSFEEADHYYVYAEAIHKSGQTDKYISRITTDSTNTITYVIYDPNSDTPSNWGKNPGGKFSGNETTKARIVFQKQKYYETLGVDYDGNDGQEVNAGGTVKGYVVAYGTAKTEEVNEADHVTEFTDHIYLTKVDLTDDYSFRSILGSGVYYGITANKLVQNNHLQTNFAVNTYEWGASNITPNLSGNSAGYIYAGTIENRIELDGGSSPLVFYTGNDVVKGSDGHYYTDETETTQVIETKGTRDNVIVKHESATNIANRVVNPIITHATNVSNKMAAHPASLSFVGGSNSLIIDTTAYEDDVTIYIDGDAIQQYLTGGKLTINKNMNQILVFNFDNPEVYIGQFKCNGVQSTTDISNTTGNQNKDKLAQTIVWNINAEDADVHIGSMFGIVLVPDGNVEIGGNTGSSSAGWIVCGGTVTNNSAEWHNIFQDMPSVEKVSLNAAKSIHLVNANINKNATRKQKFDFAVYALEENDSSWNWGDTPVKTATNEGAAVEFKDIDAEVGWNVFKIVETAINENTENGESFTRTEKEYYAAVMVYQAGQSLIAGQARYFEAFDKSLFSNNEKKDCDEIGFSNEYFGVPVFTNDQQDDSRVTHDTVTIYKVDQHGQPLPGVTFSLYSDANCTQLIKEYSGTQFTIETNDTELADYIPEVSEPENEGDDDESGSVTLYLKETDAPENVEIDETPHVIVITKTVSKYNDGTQVVTSTLHTITVDGRDVAEITFENTKNELGSVKVTKLFVGLTTLPANFQITNNINNTVFTAANADNKDTADGITTAYEWTLDNLPIGTEVVFTESGIQVDGYELTVSGATLATDKASAAAAALTAATTAPQADLVNTYALGSVKVTKVVSGTDLPDDFNITNDYNSTEFNLTNKAGGTG
ncbi:MAG: hypothetical protein IJK06_08895, partial [Clostridia bacterium]|nr:hypothetical protein [Clostridia bacterium]